MRNRRLVMAWIVPLVLLLCGCGGGGASPADKAAIREALVEALTAPDLPHVRLHIDTAEWLATIEDPSASEYLGATEAERRVQDQRFFDAIQGLGELTSLSGVLNVRAAVDAGKVEVLDQVRAATVRFQCPDADGEGVVVFEAKLRQDLRGKWRLVNVGPDFGQ